MSDWTDAHNHLQDLRFAGGAGDLLAAMKAAGIGRCVVNATHEGDWQAVRELAVGFPGVVVPAFGIHPWRAHEARAGWDGRLAELLEVTPGARIGECGIDGWVAAPPPEVQMPVLLAQLRLARDFGRTPTIHCLKAWAWLFEAFACEAPPDSFLMHSFGGSIETARRLLPLGGYFSFSGHFLHPRKQAVREVFRQLPPERILVETDAPDMLPPEDWVCHPLAAGLNHPANLPAIGRGLAEILGMPVDELAALTRDNARRCFGEVD